MSAIGAGIGWSFIDRLHWAANEKQIEVTVQDVKEIKQHLADLPSAYVSRKEQEIREEKTQEQHRETMDALRHLEGRIDQWMKDQQHKRSKMVLPGRNSLEAVSRK